MGCVMTKQGAKHDIVQCFFFGGVGEGVEILRDPSLKMNTHQKKDKQKILKHKPCHDPAKFSYFEVERCSVIYIVVKSVIFCVCTISEVYLIHGWIR